MRIHILGICQFLFWLTNSTTLHAQWLLVTSSNPVPLGQNAYYIEKTFKGPEEAKLSLVFFNDTSFSLRVITQNGPAKVANPLSNILDRSDAIAGVNGGYFDPQSFLPSALEISSGVSSGNLETNNPFEGSVAVISGSLKLLWTTELKSSNNITEMVQCNPILVSAGKSNQMLKPATAPISPRTFIATDGSGHWVIGVSRKQTLWGLSSMLGSHMIITELQIDRALNLDGGPSSGLWCRDLNGQVHDDRQGTRVRNIVAIFPRK
jgi:exopolysaccharide biosynthesis protein